MYLEAVNSFQGGSVPAGLIREIISLGLYNPDSNKPLRHDKEYSAEIGKQFSGRIQKSITVLNKRGTDILNLSATSPFPGEAALISNTIAKEFSELDEKWGADQTINLLSFLKGQLKIKEKELTVAEENVRDFMEIEKNV